MPISSLGPSRVSIQGSQLIVQKRNIDGTLAPVSPYIIRGVNWSPASPETDTLPTDPNNTTVRRSEYGKWFQTDIPLIAEMNVNTVKLFIDPGVDENLGPTGMTILDEFYRNSIMVIMTVDDGINNLDRVEKAVEFYKDHPAILIWIVGSEWNLNRYFGVAPSITDAAERTEQAAQLIKKIDQNHPVATSYGEIDIDADGLRLADTQGYVSTIARSVDIWGLNIYRGDNFGTLFDQWKSISAKPMFIGEFGTDAFRSTEITSSPSGGVDEAMQAQWLSSLWNDLFGNLSAKDPSNVALGGTVFEWNDEWWKVSPAASQEADGFILNGHADGFANEEFFGIVDIHRQKRQVYETLKAGFHPDFQPPE